jgi:myo-inositol-1(or 4)-monophosphatase
VTDTLAEIIILCAGLRDVVTPFLGLHASRDNVGAAVGGDVTFDIDEKAEAFLEAFMAERLPTWGYYSEDRGLQGPADPELILIVDPIDGTRPAAAGLEAACVSVAAVPAAAAPTMGDVVAGVVQEIRSGDVFAAEKGAGFEMRRGAGTAGATAASPPDAAIPLNPTLRSDIEGLFWTLGFRGRPALVLAGVLEELIDRSSVRGSVFDIGSATFSITRILTGQLDAYVDIGPAIIAAHPETEAEFRRVGMGGVLCNSPYDLAAAHLICREAGVPIGDADGAALDSKPVLGSDASFQMACIASGNTELQAVLVDAVQRGIDRYRFLGAPAERGNPFAIRGL